MQNNGQNKTKAHPDTISADLGGKTRFIKLGPAAFRIADLKGVLAFSLNDLNDLKFGVIAHLIYIGLLVDEPELEEITVMQWIASSGQEAELSGKVTAQLQVISELMVSMMPTVDGEETETGDEPQPGKPGMEVLN